jgi:hypothetical protein
MATSANENLDVDLFVFVDTLFLFGLFLSFDDGSTCGDDDDELCPSIENTAVNLIICRFLLMNFMLITEFY